MVTLKFQPSRQSLAKNNETLQGSRMFYRKAKKLILMQEIL